MEYSFLELIAMLNSNLRGGENFAFRLARNANTPDDYLFSNRVLPRTNKPTWNITGGTLTITPTDLKPVAMDATPAPMGNLQATFLNEQISKFGGQMFFNEKQQRELLTMEQEIYLNAGLNGGASPYGDINTQMNMLSTTGRADSATINGARINRILGIINFIKLAHWNTSESLAGEALTEGVLDENFSGLDVTVDYKVPAANIKTYSGTDRFDQSASKWWTFVRLAYKMFRNPQFYGNSNAYFDIVENPVNKVREQFLTGDVRPMSKYNENVITQKQDANERMNFNVYDKAGAVMDPRLKTLVSKPFLKDKRVIVIGELNTSQIELELGGVTDPDNALRLGYTHVGPSIEGGGRPGIYANIYTENHKPMQLFVDTYVNMLPAILNGKKLMIAKFD
jgi:hypothetical protein